MIQFTDIIRDQFVPGNNFLRDIKMEDEEDAYYQICNNVNKFNTMNEMNYNNDFKVPPISTFCTPSMNTQYYNRNNIVRNDYISTERDTSSTMRGNYLVSSDGEGSPKSVDETDTAPVYCVRGVRTITRNPWKNY